MISVVICTYNRSSMLRDALVSFFEQENLTNIPYELLLVDNGSTDNTLEVAESFASRPEVRYVYEERQGLSNARNRAISEARGDIIAYVDDDVIFSPQWLKEIWEGASRWRNASIFGGKAVAKWDFPKPKWFVDHGPYTMRGMISHFEPDLPEGPMSLCPFGCNMAFRTAVLRGSVGFPTEMGRNGDLIICGEETVLIQKLQKEGHVVVYLPKALLYHRVHGNRASKNYYVNWAKAYRASIRLWNPQEYSNHSEPFWRLLRRNCWVGKSLIERFMEWLWLGMTFRWSSMFSRWLAIVGLLEHLKLEFASKENRLISPAKDADVRQ
ncbi:MAG: glycosyltransferase family 2 protein [Armatimonadota bacterium]|nr:glycosyltransferase family 2 protein [Armatimonadota bacterium]